MLTDLQTCQTLSDLASLLGYEPKFLSFILYQIPDDKKYTSFTIPKKAGGQRQIDAPIARLRALQTKVSKLLYTCVEEIQQAHPRQYSSTFGFAAGLSIADNAKAHQGRRFVFNVDLTDFFQAVHIGRIRGFLTKDQRFLLADKVALTIAQICCHQGSLPQGAPSSPIMSNLVASVLDARLARFASQHGCRYSRYADDITFSTNLRDFPTAVAIRDDSAQGWSAGTELTERVQNAGYTLNPTKTRMAVSASRQMVTGLVVNRKVNVPEEYYKNTRAMCHRLFTGANPFEDRFYHPDEKEDECDASLAYIEGRLSYQHFIRHRFDDRSLKERQDNRSAFDKTYRDFLLYKLFYRSSKPLVITEGDSDRIYLMAAAKKLYVADSDFVLPVEEKLQLTFRVLGRTARLTEVLGLGGGTGNLIRTLVQLKDFVRKHHALVPRQPVIVLVDNDEGSVPLFKQARSLYAANLPKDNSEPFHKLKHGLYLVRTPPKGAETETFIESFLPASVLNVKLDGKTFSADDKFDTSAHFGKVRLAQFTAANASTVDFTGYAPLFERLRSVFQDWQH